MIDTILDKGLLRRWVEDLASKGSLPKSDAEAISEFLEAWRRQDKNPRD